MVGKTASSYTTLGTQFVSSGQELDIASSGSTSAANGIVLYSTGASAIRFYVGMDGTIHATNTSISAISDATLKTNVRNLETGLAEVMKLQPRRFDWINGDGSNIAGFIAQEVQEVLPELVVDSLYSYDENNNPINKLNLKMGDILPTLVRAIQELNAKVATLEAKVGA